MSKKTERKNQTNLNVKWPTTPFFTIKELRVLNPQFIAEITLRVRLTKYIGTGKAVEIGNLSGGQGRPQKVFALTPVTQETLDAAKAKNIVFIPNVAELLGKTEADILATAAGLPVIRGIGKIQPAPVPA